jgi:hypothetical protein
MIFFVSPNYERFLEFHLKTAQQARLIQEVVIPAIPIYKGVLRFFRICLWFFRLPHNVAYEFGILLKIDIASFGFIFLPQVMPA